MYADQPPVLPSPIVVERVSDHAPLQMLGFVAFGSEQDLARLDAAATAAGLRNGRVDNADGTLETMVAYVPGTDRDAALRVFREARDGRFGRIRVEAMVVTVADAADGIAMTEIRLSSPTNIDDD